MSDASLIIPGLIQVGAHDDKKGVALVQTGKAVGWTMPRGIHTWRREVSVVLKTDLTPAILKDLGVVLPEEQGEPASVARARRAAQACTLVAVEEPITDQVLAKGLRVHTVGFDSVTDGFFYISKGGAGPVTRVQGALVEMIAPTLGEGSNDELEAHLDGVIDRLLVELTEGVLSEAQIELADALPPLGPKSRMGAARLQGLEGWLILTASRSGQFEVAAREIAAQLGDGTSLDVDAVVVPLFGKARRVVQPNLELELAVGELGDPTRIHLPARSRWLVTEKLMSKSQPPVVKAASEATPSPGPTKARDEAANAAASQAAIERLAAEKEAAARAAAQKAAERAAAEKATAQRAAAKAAAAREATEKAERAAVEKAAAQKAAEREAAERAAILRLAAEKEAEERAAAARIAEQTAAEEQAAVERALAEKAAAEKEAAEREATLAAAASAPSESVPAVDLARRSVEPAIKKSAHPTKKSWPGFVLLTLVLILVIVLLAMRR